jgi:hypothetical protein
VALEFARVWFPSSITKKAHARLIWTGFNGSSSSITVSIREHRRMLVKNWVVHESVWSFSSLWFFKTEFCEEP